MAEEKPFWDVNKILLVIIVLWIALAYFFGIADNGYPLAAQGCITMPVRAARVGKESHALGILVDGRIDEGREKGKIVHAHGHKPLGDGLVVFLKEDIAPIRRRVFVKFLVELQGFNTHF